MQEAARARRVTWAVAVPPALVLLIGLLVTGVLWRSIQAHEAERVDEALERRSAELAAAVESEIRRYRDLAVGAAGVAATDDDLTREEFLSYMGSLDLAARYPGTTGVGFLVPTDAAGLPALRERLDLGDPAVDAGGGVAGGEAHFIVTSSYRADGQPPSLGIDLASAPEPADAIRRARDEGTPTLSETYVHISDRRLPPDEQQLSFIVVTPLYGGETAPVTVEGRREAVRAWVLVGLRGGDFLRDVLRVEGRGVDVELRDGAPGQGRTVAHVRDGALSPGELEASPWRRETEVQVEGRTWTLALLPRAQFLTQTSTATGELALVAGSAVSVLLAALVAALTGARRRALAIAERSTSSLRRAQADLERTNGELRSRNREMNSLATFQRDFVASASHELRTPLTAIMGYLELVLDYGEELSADTREQLEIARRASQRLLSLVGDLLTVNQVETANLSITRTPVRVDQLLAGVRELFEELCIGAGLRLGTRAPDHLPLIWADRARIDQVLANLVSNAIKFTPSGGSIDVTARLVDDRVLIDVADTGMGIAAEELPNLFNRFFRSSAALHAAIPGTGLGLHIAKAMVEAHGGELSVRSRLGEGTTFTVALPIVQLRARPKEEQWLASSSSTTTPRS